MFGRFFGARYYGPRYFGDGAGVTVVTLDLKPPFKARWVELARKAKWDRSDN